MLRAVLTGPTTGSGFDIAWFSSLSSERLCIYGAIYIFFKITVTFFALRFSELSLIGLAVGLVD